MNVTLNLPDEVANRLIALPQGEREQFAAAALTEAWSIAEEDPDADLSDDEKAAVRAGIERGAADFDAGRFSSADEFYKKMQEKHGIFR